MWRIVNHTKQNNISPKFVRRIVNHTKQNYIVSNFRNSSILFCLHIFQLSRYNITYTYAMETSFIIRSVRVAERLALPTSDHGVAGSNPAGGEILPEPKRRFIAQSLSCSPFHRLEMTEILLKGRKTLSHPSILYSLDYNYRYFQENWVSSSIPAELILFRDSNEMSKIKWALFFSPKSRVTD